MTDMFDVFETNEEAETNGIWKEFGKGTCKAKLARQGGSNTKYMKAINDLVTEYGTDKIGKLPEEKQEELYKKAFVKAIVCDHKVKVEDEWKDGVFIREGDEKKLVPFTIDNMTKCLMQLPEYSIKLDNFTKTYENYRQSIIEEHSKNL